MAASFYSSEDGREASVLQNPETSLCRSTLKDRQDGIDSSLIVRDTIEGHHLKKLPLSLVYTCRTHQGLAPFFLGHVLQSSH